MSYQVNAPTTDPQVLRLRKRYDDARRRAEAAFSRLARHFPTPMCRLCKEAPVTGSFDWTVCGACYNKHNGKPPAPEAA